MSNDITALMATMKAAAEKASNGDWRRASTLFNGITATPFVLGGKEVMIACASEKRDAEFITAASPENVKALVEALEKAQAQSSKWLEAYHKAVSVGARYEERIAELESCTVTVKLPEERFRYGESDYNDGFVNGWNAHGIETRRSLAAAGIQVIEGGA